MALIRARKKRERTLLHLFMTTKEWEILLIMTTIFHSKTPLHGRKIQRTIQMASKGSARIPSSHLYPILSQLEKEGFVKSSWEKREDPNVRHRKFYTLTEEGERRYHGLKDASRQHCEDYLKFIESILTKTISLFSDEDGEDLKISVQSLLTLILLDLLKEPTYAHDLKSRIETRFPQWELKNGTLYPLLSELDISGFLTSYWGHMIEGVPTLIRDEQGTPEENPTRLVRFYQVTEKALQKQTEYGQLYKRGLEELKQMAQFTCQYVYNLKGFQ